MTAKAPPIPPDQRSGPDDKPDLKNVRGDAHAAVRKEGLNTREQGQSGNIRQNTHNQGYQQDR